MFNFSWDNQVHLTRTGCADVCYVICMWLFWMQQLVVTGNRSEEKQGFYICQVTRSYHGILEMAYFRHIQYIFFIFKLADTSVAAIFCKPWFLANQAHWKKHATTYIYYTYTTYLYIQFTWWCSMRRQSSHCFIYIFIFNPL